MEAFDVKTGAQAYLVQRARQHNVPLGVHVDLTYECDLACVHCYLSDRKRAELTLEEYERLFDELKALGTLHLLVSGGELFTRPDALDILRAARARRFEIGLISHGGLIDDATADALAEIGITVCGMSMYSDVAHEHDEVTKVPGSWQNTIDGARRLVDRGVRVTFKVVVMHGNADVIERMRVLAADVGAHVEFSIDVKGDNEGSDRLMELNVAAADKVAMMGCVYPGLADRQTLGHFSPDRYTCMAGNASCYVSPDGTVQPCLDWEQPAGNLRERSFAEIRQESPVFRAARTIRRGSFAGCAPCDNVGHCTLCPARSLRETGSTTGSAPSKCRETMAKTVAWRALRDAADERA